MMAADRYETNRRRAHWPDTTPMMATVSWSLHRLTDNVVFIVDNCNTAGGMSVTNAAELVTHECFEHFGDRRIVYRDTDGRWDELVHRAGTFKDFAPWKGAYPQ